MLIVSDTSALNLLIQIGRAGVLPKLFDTVVIPPDVAREMSHPNAPASVQSFAAVPPSWLVTRAPTLPPAFPALGPGESSAISLAIEMQALLLIDEKAGRVVAESQGVEIIGAIGVLELAANAGLIANLAAVHDSIRATAFRVSEVVLATSLARHKAHRESSSKGTP